MATKIDFDNKENVKTSPLPRVNKVVAEDLNEIKEVVNQNRDDFDEFVEDFETFTTELDSDLQDLSDAIGLKQDALVSGTNIKTINGTSLLGSGNISTVTGGKVALYGSTGIPTFYATYEEARDAAVSGDLIMGFPGALTITTTATNGILKNGVNLFCFPGAIASKSTAGDIFNNSGFTSGGMVFGFGTFIKTGSAGHVFNMAQNNLDVNFEFQDVTSSISSAIYSSVTHLSSTKIALRGNRAASSSGWGVIVVGGNLSCDIKFMTTSVLSFHGLGLYSVPKANVNFVDITNTGGGDGFYSFVGTNLVMNGASIDKVNCETRESTFNVAQITNFSLNRSDGKAKVNGLINNVLQFNGLLDAKEIYTLTCATTTGGQLNAILISSGVVNVNGTGNINVNLEIGRTQVGGGQISSFTCSNANAKVVIKGHSAVAFASFTVSNGFTKVNGYFILNNNGGGNTSWFQTGGKLKIENAVLDTSMLATAGWKQLDKSGGTLVLDNATFIIGEATQIPINCGTVQDVKIYRVKTNKVGFVTANMNDLIGVAGSVIEDADVTE